MINDIKYVELDEGFWKRKYCLNRDVTMKAVYDRFSETGRISAFNCDWKEGMPDKPHFFWDSDVAKWMEAGAYILEKSKDGKLESKLEELIDKIVKNMHPDGYFNIYHTVVEPENRWRIRDHHELYCAGHLMEAACAYYKATGKDRFLKYMKKYAKYISHVFMKEHSASFNTPGHEEIETALYKMFKTTGDSDFYELMKYFLERRGAEDNDEEQIFGSPEYSQSHAPIREQREAVGHSVRAVYLYSAMAEYAAESGDTELFSACTDLFRDITEKKMYITGGIGSTNIGEAFTVPFDLPNARAYTETCASVGLAFFAERMFFADPVKRSVYADITELEMYNGALSGLSLDGNKFFYENPLEIKLSDRRRITATKNPESWPITQRVHGFYCSCCPPNLNRFLASIGRFFYSYDENERSVYIHQFGSSKFEYENVSVSQSTKYPLNGKIKIKSNVPVYVRIPGWCRDFSADSAFEYSNGYIKFAPGDISVELVMRPELFASDPRVTEDIGKAALRYGPFVYCAEGVDNNDLFMLFFDADSIGAAKTEYSEDFDAPIITVRGWRAIPRDGGLYERLDGKFEITDIKLIPYYCFANRGESDMRVFMNYRKTGKML